jgi:hypothetical protein
MAKDFYLWTLTPEEFIVRASIVRIIRVVQLVQFVQFIPNTIKQGKNVLHVIMTINVKMESNVTVTKNVTLLMELVGELFIHCVIILQRIQVYLVLKLLEHVTIQV